MKRVIFIVLSLIVVYNIHVNAQIHLEIGGGYIAKTPNGSLLTHNSDGWLISASVFYELTDNLELNSTLDYHSFLFSPNSFDYPMIQFDGHPIPMVIDGDNLKSIGISIGGRIKSYTNTLVNLFLSLHSGLTYYDDSYYTLRYPAEYGIRIAYESPLKYSEEKYLFETSAGVGVIISPLRSIELILEGQLTYAHKVKEVFFPISAKIKINI